MPTIILPHTFHDNIGEVASGVQVMDNLNALKAVIEELAAPRLFLPGDLKPVAVAAAPAGWLLCQGQAISRIEYEALWLAVGTLHGAGDGSTTFNIPDGRGRSLIGAGTPSSGEGASAHALGSKGGDEKHALSTAELAAHNHGGATGGGTSGNQSADHTHTDAGHAHGSAAGAHDGFLYYRNSAGSALFLAKSTAANHGLDEIAGVPESAESGLPTGTAAASLGGVSANHTHSVPALGIGSDGGGTAHQNMQPYFVGNWIIKT